MPEESGQSFALEPLTPSLGAVVSGLDARSPLERRSVAALEQAVLSYKVLFFPRLGLSDSEHRRFADHFGPPFDYTGRFTDEYEEPGLSKVTVVPHFHADFMYREEGPSYSMLQMLELPDVGGDTIWADLQASYEALSPALRRWLEQLTAVHAHPLHYASDEALRDSHGRRFGKTLSDLELAALRRELAPREHPLVRRIPQTGGANYWLSAQHTRALKGLSPGESDALLAFLFGHQLRPQFLLRWRWQVGDLAFWDHRTTLHSGVADYAGSLRRARRASIGANRPLAAATTGAAAEDRAPAASQP